MPEAEDAEEVEEVQEVDREDSCTRRTEGVILKVGDRACLRCAITDFMIRNEDMKGIIMASMATIK